MISSALSLFNSNPIITSFFFSSSMLLKIFIFSPFSILEIEYSTGILKGKGITLYLTLYPFFERGIINKYSKSFFLLNNTQFLQNSPIKFLSKSN